MINIIKCFFAISLCTYLICSNHITFAKEVNTTGKLITVDISKQKLYAWEGGKVVFESKVSTGMRYTPTLKGSFTIYKKVEKGDMSGKYGPYPKYYIKNVPNIMYYSGAYAIHGVYWHNSFGTRASHGCVNLPVKASEWVYNFADVGTAIEIF